MDLKFILQDAKTSHTLITGKYKENMKLPKSVKECNSRYGIVNFFSSFLKQHLWNTEK